MARAGPRKVREDSLEFKLPAVRLSQQPGMQVQAVAAVRAGRSTPRWVSASRRMRTATPYAPQYNRSAFPPRIIRRSASVRNAQRSTNSRYGPMAIRGQSLPNISLSHPTPQ